MNFYGILFTSSIILGALWLIISVWWLVRRSSFSDFRKAAMAFVLAGVIVPFVLISVWVRGTEIEGIAPFLWPTSIMLMALDQPSPSPVSSIALVYGMSILGNIGIYGTAGLPLSMLYARLRQKKRA
jgi:hypothetical protein